MPKQIFQRPVRVPVQRNQKVKSGIPGQPDFGRKTGRAVKAGKHGKSAK